MRSPYGNGEASIDRNAVWAFAGLDVTVIGALFIILGLVNLRSGEAFWAPVILLITNGLAGTYFYKKSDRAKLTALLGMLVAITMGMAFYYLYVFQLQADKSMLDNDFFLGPAGFIAIWTVIGVFTLGVYFRNLNEIGG